MLPAGEIAQTQSFYLTRYWVVVFRSFPLAFSEGFCHCLVGGDDIDGLRKVVFAI